MDIPPVAPQMTAIPFVYAEHANSAPVTSAFASKQSAASKVDVVYAYASIDAKNTTTYTSKYSFSGKELIMGDISRDEISARLDKNKAEVDSVAADMRREMAEFRTNYTLQFSSLDKGISEIKGELGGLKTSLTTSQSNMAIGLALVTILLSGVMLASSWILSGKEPPDTNQPVVIQIPQQAATPPAVNHQQ